MVVTSLNSDAEWWALFLKRPGNEAGWHSEGLITRLGTVWKAGTPWYDWPHFRLRCHAGRFLGTCFGTIVVSVVGSQVQKSPGHSVLQAPCSSMFVSAEVYFLLFYIKGLTYYTKGLCWHLSLPSLTFLSLHVAQRSHCVRLGDFRQHQTLEWDPVWTID